jgi:tRNA-dihydrouridine synthase B
MAGYTDNAFRSLCRRYHSGAVFTEVVNAEGIVRGSRPTLHLLETLPGERPIAAHIYGANPDSMAQAAAIIEKLGRFDFIDINCGCPVRKIVAKGAGAALMKTPEKIETIVRAIRSAVALPVTVKTRIGYSPDKMNISEVAHAVEAGGGQAIFIHARFAANQHRGPADWETLARIKTERTIPVIGNGGVLVAQDALDMFSQTHVDGVMIGRAAVGNPWIFDEIRCLAEGKPYTAHSLEEHRAVIFEHLEKLTALTKKQYRRRKSKRPIEDSAVLQFRAHLVRYLAGFHGFSEVRRRLQNLHSPAALQEAVDSVIANETSLPDRTKN